MHAFTEIMKGNRNSTENIYETQQQDLSPEIMAQLPQTAGVVSCFMQEVFSFLLKYTHIVNC